MTKPPVSLLVADVDGTLVTHDKELTVRAIEAVHGLYEAGVLFAITSGRPPRGMAMLIGPLELSTPIAAFNGGMFVRRDMDVIEQKTLPAQLVEPVVSLLESFDLSVWLYRGADWFVHDLEGPHVARESWTVGFSPSYQQEFDTTREAVKIVGVSDDHERVEAATSAAHDAFGEHVSASRSQPYYLDVTHPLANKGHVLGFLSDRYGIPEERIATIGDMPNDVLMFAHSGLSIAMGNATLEVQRAARRVTTSNDEEGFANAVEDYLLKG